MMGTAHAKDTDLHSELPELVPEGYRPETGSNVLVKTGNGLHLLKYEGHNYEMLPRNEHRVNRSVSICSMPPSLIGLNRPDPNRGVLCRCTLNLYGTHRISWWRDPECGELLPYSDGTDLFHRIAWQDTDGVLHVRSDLPSIIVGDEKIARYLFSVNRPRFHQEVVVPFMQSHPTRFRLPRWSWWRRYAPTKFMKPAFERAYVRVAERLDPGAFIYVGCKEEVVLLGVAKVNGRVYFQGTYTASMRPPMLFTNNSIGFDPLGRTAGAAFGGEGFIFPTIWRGQNCNAALFEGEPELITGDLDRARKHFRKTDFAPFADLLDWYAATMHEPVPDALREPFRVGEHEIYI